MNKNSLLSSNFDELTDNFYFDEETLTSDDELSSDEIDSDVEFHLYSQIHYAADNDSEQESCIGNTGSEPLTLVNDDNNVAVENEVLTSFVKTEFEASNLSDDAADLNYSLTTPDECENQKNDRIRTRGNNFDVAGPSSRTEEFETQSNDGGYSLEQGGSEKHKLSKNDASEEIVSKKLSVDGLSNHGSPETKTMSCESPEITNESDGDENSSTNPIEYFIGSDFIVTDEVSADDSNPGYQSNPSGSRTPILVDKSDKTKSKTIFKEEDIAKLRAHLDSETSEVDFVPETWEIVDSVEDDSSDSCDGGIDLHISEKKEDSCEEIEQEPNEAWIPGKGPKSCWKIDREDMRQVVVNPGNAARYFGGANKSKLQCRNCNEVGHKAKDCTVERKLPACFMCGIRGHVGRDCPEKGNIKHRGRNFECDRCAQMGHIQIDCPDLWRQFHVTTTPGRIEVPQIPVKLKEDPQCYNCAGIGHFGHECESEMPSSQHYYAILAPFVHRYDKHAVSEVPQDLRKKLKRKRVDEEQEIKSKERFGEKVSRASRSSRESSSRSRHFEENRAGRQNRQHIIFEDSSSPEKHSSASKRKRDKVTEKRSYDRRSPLTKKHQITHEEAQASDKSLTKKQRRRRNVKLRKEAEKQSSTNCFDKRVVFYDEPHSSQYDKVQFSNDMQDSQHNASHQAQESSKAHGKYDHKNPKKRKFSNSDYKFNKPDTSNYDKKRKFDDRSRDRTDRGFRRRFN